jgi:hypothetical protein
MINELMNIGDIVTITIPAEAREWGHNPCADGTTAKILEFGEIYLGRVNNFGLQPGVHVNRSWVTVQVLRDKTVLKVNSSRLELVATNEYQRRLAEFREHQRTNPGQSLNDGFLRELPATSFWEGDFVRVDDAYTVFQITGINYARLAQRRDDETMYPAYNISSSIVAGWYIGTSEDSMKLFRRGNVWKFFNGERITFANIKEEAQFHKDIGHTEEVVNPANGRYHWTREEVLAAIASGAAHGFSLVPSVFGLPDLRIRALRFRDPELGERVAAATLKGFRM